MEHYALPLAGSVIAGALIGFEREYRSRPAGFRTHILVCLASALLMIGAMQQSNWMVDASAEVIRIDPARMAHGVLTGIGFLCGGVIFREGFSVHGLTTAASLWITSAIGTLYGVGEYGLATGGAVLTLMVLAFLRWADVVMPGQQIVDVVVRYRREQAIGEAQFRSEIEAMGFKVRGIRHQLMEAGAVVELASPLRASRSAELPNLAERLMANPRVLEFQILPRD
jgi:putative Mg2+ transporter-C (MgtC) family protein